ncbi:hypothetical protein R3P38DRAFT_3301503 [Favolaschia claudopus]|uniref:BHLH domain-containing protein n=1 Tax=Favolaschia claudopus TaxID=2862362 RepID=A0AAW0EIA4_9AGAR
MAGLRWRYRQIYSLAGGIFLLQYGQYFFFYSPEWQIYGGIGMGIMGVAIVTVGALSVRSYTFSRAMQFVWPFIIVAAAVRAIIMIVELNRGKEKIQWECDNGGQLYWESQEKNYSSSPKFPTQFCIVGFQTINTAFIVSLIVDLAFQMYMFFLVWRFCARLVHYSGMKGPFGNATPSYMDAMDASFGYMDSDYLRYPPSPSSFEPSIDLPPTTLPRRPPAAPTPVVAPFNPPTRPFTPIDGAGISPPSLVGPSYTLSAGELSSDGLTSGRRSRGSGSHSPPASYPTPSSVPRALSSHRFNPIATPATRTRPQRRKPSRRDDDSDDEDDDFQPTVNSLIGGADSRRETIRKQRIESEQRRRDELRDGYARLKETLPPTNQKSSKVSLLDRATNHVRNLEIAKVELEKRLKDAESEVKHLRHINEVLSVRAVNHNQQRGIATF